MTKISEVLAQPSLLWIEPTVMLVFAVYLVVQRVRSERRLPASLSGQFRASERPADGYRRQIEERPAP
jgi:cytochrome c-type biogenesis protein CcmH/NrfF